MRFLKVSNHNSAFLREFYAQHEGIANRPYTEQLHSLMAQGFGTADFYSSNLERLGYEAKEIVANCKPLQLQWAREHGLILGKASWTLCARRGWIPWVQRQRDWFYPILSAQVKHDSPDVLYMQNMSVISPTFLREVRPYVRLIAGQIASTIRPGADFSEYDLILSSLPHYVQRFQELGISSQIFRLGFEHTLLTKLKTSNSDTYPVVHIGGYGPVHRQRNELLEVILTHGIPLACWGYRIEHLPEDSPVRRSYRGNAWGLDMYSVYHNSKIVVTKHISSVADVYANIMTMYEATGAGALLVVDARKDLHNIFEPGKEVVAYRSEEECAELITYYLERESACDAIAQAGQSRTLREHTYYHRMQELVEIIKRHL